MMKNGETLEPIMTTALFVRNLISIKAISLSISITVLMQLAVNIVVVTLVKTLLKECKIK